jgi:tRNA (cmo5U34)-methyltransferase
METYRAEVWKLGPIVERYLGLRADLPLAQEQIGVMLAILATRPEPVSRFLDLGCGDGILGAALLGSYPESQGVLADFSEPMLAQARARLQEFAPQLEFLNLDYADPAWVKAVQHAGPFDAIVSGYSIHHQPDQRKKAIYAGIFDLLQPGGWFVNIEHIAPASTVAKSLFENHFIDALYTRDFQSGGAQTREQVAKAFLNSPERAANILAPVDAQCDWLQGIGFEEVDCYCRIYELAVFAGRRPVR